MPCRTVRAAGAAIVHAIFASRGGRTMRHGPFPITVEFTFSYLIDGAVVAEFDARATATVPDIGCPPQFNPVHGGDPGWGPEWDNYRAVEVASAQYARSEEHTSELPSIMRNSYA